MTSKQKHHRLQLVLEKTPPILEASKPASDGLAKLVWAIGLTTGFMILAWRLPETALDAGIVTRAMKYALHKLTRE